MSEEKKGDFIREFFKRWPRLYYCVAVIFGPVWFVNVSAKSFLMKYPKEGKTLNVGSGPKVISPDVINVDITPYENVSVIAEATDLPFEDSSIARIICDNVLEHVEQPEKAVAEASRVIMPGGYIYVSTPFLYPFHSSPSDFMRWTDEGMNILLARHGFDVVEHGVRTGPFSVLILWLCYFLASLLCFGSRRLYWFIVNISLFIFFPIKLFDILASRLPFSHNLTSVLYFVAKKK